jgi:hypothetical protein
MYTIRNSNNDQKIPCEDMAYVKQVFKAIVWLYGRAALRGMYVEKAGERDPYRAEDLVK